MYPVDITAMMSTGYIENSARPPSCLASGLSGLGTLQDVDLGGQHPVHPVNIPGCDVDWTNCPNYYPAGDAIHEAPVVGDYGWGPADQGVKPEDGEPAQEG
ncbi:hypothetical protein AAC387_Pa10g0418 [Persea americana]